MKNRIIALVVGMLLLLFSSLFSQAPDVEWKKHYVEFAKGYSVLQTSDGGYIVAGEMTSSATVVILKTDKNGDSLWTKKYDGGFARCIEPTNDSGYVIAGFTDASDPLRKTDFLLLKTNADGDTLWTRRYGFMSHDFAFSVQQTSDSGFIIAGQTRLSQIRNDVYIVKTNSMGDLSWGKTYGGLYRDAGYCVKQTSDKGYIIVGRFDTDRITNWDVYVLKLDSLGNEQWSKTYDGKGYNGLMDIGYSFVEKSEGGYVIAGSVAIHDSTGWIHDDLYLFEIDSVGDTLWTRNYGYQHQEQIDWGYSVEQTTDGGYIIAGESRSWSYGNDLYLVRTSTTGDSIWTKRVGRQDQTEIGYSLKQTSDGGYITTGRTGVNTWAEIFLVKIKPIKLISPNGDEGFLWDSTHTIQWRCEKHFGHPFYFRLLLSVDGGITYPGSIAPYIDADSTSWEWTIPHVESKTCRVKVQIIDSLNNIVAEDESDRNFSIDATAIEEMVGKEKKQILFLNASPNPFKTFTMLNFLCVSENQNAILDLYDVSGRLVKSVKLETSTHQLGADLVPGVYFLKFTMGAHEEIQKLIKIR